MCQYGHQVTISPTETVVLCCSPLATPPCRHSISKKRPLRRSAEGLRLRLFPNSHMAVFYSPFIPLVRGARVHVSPRSSYIVRMRDVALGYCIILCRAYVISHFCEWHKLNPCR